MRTAGLLLLSWLALPSLAREPAIPDPGQRYRVVGVEAGDVLNVRAHPGTGSPIVGELAPDAEGIVVAGTRMRLDGGVWWQVAAPEGIGWVNARHLAPDGTPLAERESFPLRCVGTEPFWNARIEGGEARFETPEESQGWRAGPMNPAIGLVGRFAVRLEDGEETGNLSAWRNPAFCSDGMSDVQFPYESILVAPDGRVFGGCCLRGGE